MRDPAGLSSTVARLRQRFEFSPAPVRAALFAPVMVDVGVHLASKPQTEDLVAKLFESGAVADEIQALVALGRVTTTPPPVEVVIVDELRLFIARMNREIEVRAGSALVQTSDSSYRCPTAKGARVALKYYPPPSQVGAAGGVLVEAWVRFSDARSGPLDEHRITECFGLLGSTGLALEARGGWKLGVHRTDHYVGLSDVVPAMQVMGDLVAYFKSPGSIAEFVECRTELRAMKLVIFEQSAFAWPH